MCFANDLYYHILDRYVCLEKTHSNPKNLKEIMEKIFDFYITNINDNLSKEAFST